MQKRWELAEPNPELAQRLAQAHQIPPAIAQILINRSIVEDEAVRQFLHPSLAHLPDPFQMMGMKSAVSRLIHAIRSQEPITIFGDYDVDGTTGTALLVTFLREVGAVVDYYIPHRIREGYSLNVEALKKLKERGTRVVITVDNGISALREAKAARELGLDLIITDHHEVPETLPPAFTILNPKQAGDTFPGKELAGVGVAFYLAIGLRKALRDAGMLGDREPNLRGLLDLVAVGTIADMAPLTGLNRILVKEGLKVLGQRPRPGLRAILDVSGVQGEVRADQVAFRVGPRINAVGRLDDANLGVHLLLSDNPEETKGLAQNLNQANEERQALEDKIVVEAVQRIESQGLHTRHRSLVLKGEDWHQGVIGIVASRLVERFYLPAIVLTRDQDGLKGSARSIRGLDLVEALRECSSLLIKFGGHRYAAGLSMKEGNFSTLAEHFDQAVRARVGPQDFTPKLRLDARSLLRDIEPQLLHHLENLAPFGLGNPEPTWLLSGASVRESRVVGERHLRLKVGEGKRQYGVIGFRLAEKIPPVGAEVDLAFTAEWHEWNGHKSIQLKALDLCLTG